MSRTHRTPESLRAASRSRLEDEPSACPKGHTEGDCSSTCFDPTTENAGSNPAPAGVQGSYRGLRGAARTEWQLTHDAAALERAVGEKT